MTYCYYYYYYYYYLKSIMSVYHFVQPQFQLEFCVANIDETWHDSSAI